MAGSVLGEKVLRKEDPRFLRMKLSVSALEMSAEVLDEESF